MTEEEITKDRQSRVKSCKEELEVVLAKYQLALTAEDMIGQHTKIQVELQFMDLKKYDSPIAQPDKPIFDMNDLKKPFIEDILGPNEPIGKKK